MDKKRIRMRRQEDMLHRLRDGRISEAELSDDDIRILYTLKDRGLVDADLFNETPDGNLCSYGQYWFLRGEDRNMEGRFPENWRW